MKKNKYYFIKVFFIYSALFFAGVFLCPNTAQLSSLTAEKIIELTNEERSRLDLNRLGANARLTAAAEAKAEAVVRSEIFQHEINGKKFSQWIKEAGYEYSYVGENLALNFLTPQGAVAAWLESLTHKKNLLGENFTEVGVAVYSGWFKDRETTLIVQIFGAPPAALTKKDSAPRPPQTDNLNMQEKSSATQIEEYKTALIDSAVAPAPLSANQLTFDNYLDVLSPVLSQTINAGPRDKREFNISGYLAVLMAFFILTGYYYIAHDFNRKLLAPENKL